jgi:hypothetical protein
MGAIKDQSAEDLMKHFIVKRPKKLAASPRNAKLGECPMPKSLRTGHDGTQSHQNASQGILTVSL